VASPRTAKELLATLQTEMSAMEATKESSSETAGGAATASTTGIAASSVYGCWVTWMRLEILQRGVLWTHGMTESSSSSSSSTPAVTNDEEKELDDARHLLLSQLLAAVQAVAGKALLFQAADGSEAEPSTLPRPLLASAAALQAKVAEQVARHFRVQHPRTDNDSTAASTSHPVSSEAQLDRLQELLFRIHTTSTTTATGPKSPKKTHPRPDNPNSLVATVLERCRQVHDERFLLALQLVTEHKTGGTTSFHNNANDSSAAASATTVAIHDAWLILAQGGYYRAAACQPNAPPLWKRAWETEQQLQVTTVTGGDHASRTTTTTASTMNTRATTRRRPHWESHHALPALQALIRIATSKGNAKRVAELTLRLASAWLHAAAAGASPSSTANTPLPFQQRLTDVFVTPVRHLPPDVTRPRAALAHAAASLAQTATTNLPAATNATEAAASAAVVVNQWYHDVLTLDLWVVQHQVGLAEAVAANARAQPALLAKRTSSQPERTTATVAATAYWRDQWKQRTIHENSGTDADHRPHVTEEEVYATVERLVHVLHGSNGSDKPESSPSLATHHDSHLVSAAWLAIEDVCTYQYEYLCAVSASFDDDSMPPNTNSSEFTTGWQLLAMLLSTIWTRLAPTPTDENNPEDLTSAPQWAFWETLSHLVCRLAWATLAWHMEAPSVWSLSPSLWQQIHWALSSALDQSKIQSSSQTQVALSSQWQPAQIQSLRLRVARLAAQCWRLLNSRDRLELQDIAHVTRDLIILSNHGEVFVALDADYGASLLASLLAWSGFFRTPWEFAIASEGRILLQTTRSVMKRAHSQWGRISHPLEDLLLFIAEGDLETHGGLVDKARKLYEKVTTSPCLGQGNGQSTAASILTARCHLGLAKLAALNSENSSSDLAFKSLEILKSLPAEPTGLLMWKSPLLRDLAVQSQIVVSKQLIADHLIQLGKMREAGDFLESCVKDAPTDEVASFTFGAYLLRMVFFQGHDSSESLKRAQTQLLKAAKLNPHMASPFALLGYLYESKNDLKRATGCYSKALSLEPFHPVAGRGMIRLTDDGAVQPIIDNAINCVSSLNGWAWHYVGHAMLQKEGKDELAISALLKATRSRDIDDPSSDPLSIFYSGPEFPAHPSQINHIHSLQDLALCYRRLGRCSAELRTLQAALELSGESPSWSLLQACAQGKGERSIISDMLEQLHSLIAFSNSFFS
jgi:tetratricopeptide (TPR) repeat protein